MNQRLETICRLIRPGIGLIDVGTDHGYLPEKLALEAYPGRLFASDIRRAPLECAKRTAERSGVSDKISFLLCDGLELCPPEQVDTIVVAGMGGDAICGILDRAEWCWTPAYRLLLQPMSKQEVLRYFLVNNGFSIDREVLVRDAGEIYQILDARFCGENSPLSDAELYIGKQGSADRELHGELLEKLAARFERRREGIRRASESSAAEESFTKAILREIDAIRRGSNGDRCSDL